MNGIRELRAAVAAKGFDVSVNQAGPLLEQLARRGEVKIIHARGAFLVGWNNVILAKGDTIFLAALRCAGEMP